MRVILGVILGVIFGVIFDPFFHHFLTIKFHKFLYIKNRNFLQKRTSKKVQNLKKTVSAGGARGPKKPSLSNRRIGTRNTDSHMIPI